VVQGEGDERCKRLKRRERGNGLSGARLEGEDGGPDMVVVILVVAVLGLFVVTVMSSVLDGRKWRW